MDSEGGGPGGGPWQPLGMVLHPQPVSGMCFDPVEERLWLADTDGFLASYTYPDMSLFTRTRTCWVTNYDEPAWSVTAFRAHGIRPLASSSGISVTTGASLRLYDRGGLLLADVPASSLSGPGRQAAAASSQHSFLTALPLDSFDEEGGHNTSRIVVAGTLPEVHLLDASRLWVGGGPGGGVHRGSSVATSVTALGLGMGARNLSVRSVVTLPVPYHVGSLALSAGRSLIAAALDGPSLTVFDALMRSPAPTARLTGHTGGTICMDATRQLLVSVGCSTPGESPTYPGPRAVGTGGRPTLATLDACLKVWDMRMTSRPTVQLTVPGAGRGGAPLYVKFMPVSAGSDPDPPLLVGTVDGRLFLAHPSGPDRLLSPVAALDGPTLAMARAAMRGEPFVPTPENTRIRISSVCLSPSGSAAALADSEGGVHVLGVGPGLGTSLMGYASMAGALVCGPEPWLGGGEEALDRMPIDATAPPNPAPRSDREVNSFAAAVVARARAAAGPGFGSPSSPPPASTAAGNALNSDEAGADTLYDAAALAGAGMDVPVAAPGLCSLIPPLPYRPWDALWSTSLETVEAVNPPKADFWGDSRPDQVGGGGAGEGIGTPGRPGKVGKARAGRSAQHHFYAPGKDRVSTFPEGYTDTVLVSLLRRSLREVDPQLLGMVDRTGAYVNNRAPALRLRPNTLVYGARKGWVNVDPRQKAPGRSTLVVKSRGRAGSVDSASTGGSSADLSRLMRGDDMADSEEEEAEEEEEDVGEDAASVDTLTSFSKGRAGEGGGYTPLLRRGRLRVPRVYKRPRLIATRYGFFDTDYSKYSGVGPGYEYAGLEEVGPNSFINAPVQLLFFIRSLRRRVQAHLCSHPHCTACEMRFLFDGMVQSPSLAPDARVMPAHNLARVLVHGDARKLGVLHPCTLEPGRRMELYLRTALDRLSKELNGLHSSEEVAPSPAWVAYTEGGSGAVGSQEEKKGGRGSGGGGKGGKGGAPSGQGRAGKGGAPEPSSDPTSPPPSSPLPPVDRGSTPEALLSIRMSSTTTCTTGGGNAHATSRDSDVYMLDMSYPSAPPPGLLPNGQATPSGAGQAGVLPLPPTLVPGPEYSCAAVVRGSFVSARRQKAWCEGCKAYTPTTVSKAAVAAGPLLGVAANLGGSDAWARELWRTRRGDGGSWIAPALDVGFGPASGSGGVGAGVYVLDGRDGAPAPGSPATPPPGTARYVLSGMLLHVPPGSSLKPIGGTGTGASTGPTPARAASAPSSTTTESGAVLHYHYVSVLRVGPGEGAYVTRAGLPHQWLVFNDFRVNSTTEVEALDLRPAWKRPCILLYSRVDHDGGPSPASVRYTAQVKALVSAGVEEGTAHSSAVAARAAAGYLFPACFPLPASLPPGRYPAHVMPLACDALRVPPSVFGMGPSIPAQPMLGPAPVLPALPADAVPKTGELLALDAEFVAVSSERARVRSDGTRQLLASARLMPGRLSVVRDTGGPVAGSIAGSTVPLAPIAMAHRVIMDTHVVQGEPIVDHLTRFSGIQAGDLEMESSPRRLHTYKSVYLRLRAMMDVGARIVGHGLRKDFRELGAVLPPSQAVDTVQLWKQNVPGARYLSLRFLASHVLGTDIQGTVHDSNEDAECALALYRAHAELEAECGRAGVDRLLDALYAVGRATGWKARTHGAPSVPSSFLPASLRPKEEAVGEQAEEAVPDRHAPGGVGGSVPVPTSTAVGMGHLVGRGIPVRSAQDARSIQGQGQRHAVPGSGGEPSPTPYAYTGSAGPAGLPEWRQRGGMGMQQAPAPAPAPYVPLSFGVQHRASLGMGGGMPRPMDGDRDTAGFDRLSLSSVRLGMGGGGGVARGGGGMQGGKEAPPTPAPVLPQSYGGYVPAALRKAHVQAQPPVPPHAYAQGQEGAAIHEHAPARPYVPAIAEGPTGAGQAYGQSYGMGGGRGGMHMGGFVPPGAGGQYGLVHGQYPPHQHAPYPYPGMRGAGPGPQQGGR